MDFFVFFSQGGGGVPLKNYCDIVYKCTIMVNCSEEASETKIYKSFYHIDVNLRNFAYVSSFSQFFGWKKGL